MPKKKVSTTKSLNDGFRKKHRNEVIKRWVIRILGIIVIALFFAVLFFATRFFSFAAKPIREFQHFASETRMSIGTDHQLYIGIWYEEVEKMPKRNAIAVISPEKASITLLTVPQEISAENPRGLSAATSLPIDRYIIIPHTLNKGVDLSTFIKSLTSQWYAEYSGIKGYLQVPSIAAELGKKTYTDVSPRELSGFVQFIHSVSVEDIKVVDWPVGSLAIEDVRLSYFVDPEVTKGNNRVWIRNNTEIPGLATAVSSYLANVGFEIVRVDTYECVESVPDDCSRGNTRILVNEAQVEEYSVTRMREILGGNISISDAEDLKRVDIVVHVGENLEYLIEAE